MSKLAKVGLAAAGVLAAQEVWRRAREKDLRGDVALITGAGTGIGREMALLLAEAGCTLVLWGRREGPLLEVAEEIKALAAADPTGSISSIVRVDTVDVGVHPAVEAAAAAVLADLGRVDLLINNAGVHEGPGALDRTPDEIQAVFDVNVMSHIWTLKGFLPSMMERDHGHVVTVGSAAGTLGVAGMLDYCASKFAVRGLNESLRMQLHKAGSSVRCTMVSPFYIDTGMFEGVRSRFNLPGLLPILKQEVVAARIVTAVRRNAVELQMPPIVYTVDLFRGLFPAWAFDLTAGILGLNQAMDNFVQTRDNRIAPREGEAAGEAAAVQVAKL